MQRLPDWEERLTAVLTESFARPFRHLGCCLFPCRCIEAVTGADLTEGFDVSDAGQLGPRGVEAVAEDVAARCRIPEIAPALSRIGDVVLIDTDDGPTLGICLGEHAAFADEEGLTMRDIGDCRRAWRL